MKCKAFASPLEAHVGQSPVRGGKAIKTDRNTSNNLNQLLSHVKSIFGRKATPALATTPNAKSPTDLSIVSDPSISAAFAAIENISPKTTALQRPNCAMRIIPTAQASSRKTRHSRPRLSSSRTLTASTTSPTT